MKLGISLLYSGSTYSVPVKKIQRAEELGYESVWTAEAYGSDAITPLAYIAALTKRIKLGTAIAQLAARTPANLAMCAQTIDAMAGGDRMLVGIGVSGPQIVEGWYGEPWGSPAGRLRDYVAICKKIWKREGPVSHMGKEISLPYKGPGATGLGKPLKSILHGNPRIPVLLGTISPGNIRLTAEIADGWFMSGAQTASVKHFIPVLQEGFAKRSDGMTLKDFRIQGSFNVIVTGDSAADVQAALDSRKPEIALYVGGMGAEKKNFHNENMIRNGFPEAAARIQELFLAGRKDEAAAAVPDEFVELSGLFGPEARLKERWKRWADLPLYGLTLNTPSDEAMEVMAKIAIGQ